jgi:hypothetical protein
MRRSHSSHFEYPYGHYPPVSADMETTSVAYPFPPWNPSHTDHQVYGVPYTPNLYPSQHPLDMTTAFASSAPSSGLTLSTQYVERHTLMLSPDSPSIPLSPSSATSPSDVSSLGPSTALCRWAGCSREISGRATKHMRGRLATHFQDWHPEVDIEDKSRVKYCSWDGCRCQCHRSNRCNAVGGSHSSHPAHTRDLLNHLWKTHVQPELPRREQAQAM